MNPNPLENRHSPAENTGPPSLMRLDDAYRLLDLGPNASDEEVRDTVRDLTKVWHPDRFAHDPSVQRKADEKLKRINEAYQTIRAAREGSGPRRGAPRPEGSETREGPAMWRVRTAGREGVVPDLAYLIAFVERGRIGPDAEVFHPGLGKWLPLAEVPELQQALMRSRMKRRRGWALACSLAAAVILLRRPTPGGLIIALILFGISALLILSTRRYEK